MKSNIKIYVTPELLRSLYEYSNGKRAAVAKSKPFFETAKLNYEGQPIYAEIKEGQKATTFHIYEKDEELVCARLTRINVKYGLKTYMEYGPGIIEDYQKRNIKETFRLIASTYLMIVFAYENQENEDCPFVFDEGQDSHGDTVVLIKFVKEGTSDGQGEVTHRAAPKEPFAVRGHYRKLKSGKVVWVRAHEKGKWIDN